MILFPPSSNTGNDALRATPKFIKIDRFVVLSNPLEQSSERRLELTVDNDEKRERERERILA